jgi:hypothetical protein
MRARVTRDPVLEAAHLEQRLEGCHQVLGEYPWLEWCREVACNERLFCLRHKAWGTFVLAVWAYSPEEVMQPVFVEIEVLARTPDHVWPFGMHPEVFRKVLEPTPQKIRRMKRKKAEREAAIRAEREERAWRRGESVRYLKKRGFDAAAAIMDGVAPYAVPDPENVKKLREAARGVVGVLIDGNKKRMSGGGLVLP